MVSLNEYIKNPKLSKQTTKRYNSKRFKVVTKKTKTTAEEEYTNEIYRFSQYIYDYKPELNDKNKFYEFNKFLEYAEDSFKYDNSLNMLLQNLRSDIFREGIKEIYIKEYLRENQVYKKLEHSEPNEVKGKTKIFKGFSFSKFNVVKTRWGVRFIDKNTGRFIKRPKPEDFI